MTAEYPPPSHEAFPDDPDVVAKAFGHQSLEELAQQIPRDARVLSIGSGTTEFAKTLGLLRFDIDITSIDPSFAHPETAKQAQAYAPKNIDFVVGTVDQLGDEFSEDRFRTIYYYDGQSDENSPTIKTVAKTLPNLLAKPGVLYLAPVAKGIGSRGTYDERKQLLTITDIKPQPRLQPVFEADNHGNGQRGRMIMAAILGVSAVVAAKIIKKP